MSNFISPESISEVENRADIVEVVNSSVPLTKKGESYWGCCPFHGEKTPSFTVNPDKKLFYCFGCHKGGTVFNFIMEMERLSYTESVEYLAKKYGIALKYGKSGNAQFQTDPTVKLKEEYIDLYNRVATTFHYMLLETEAGKFALNYILSRGITKETIEKFKLGYSPSNRKWLKSFLLKKNYSDDFLQKSGLFSKNYPDYAFFNDRLMFPIFDKSGSVVAMGGRFLRGDATKSPKYLNSGDLIQYKKGQTLYAFNFAKQSIRESKKVIFCEGYMDCIAYHQCGITYAVAPLGTALTEDQIKIVKPFVDVVLLSFDSDDAGQNATRRAILMCRKLDVSVRVIQLSGGKDPAEIMIKYGGDFLTGEVNNAILDSDYLLSKLGELYPKDTPEGKTRACFDYFEYVDSLQSEVQINACLDQLSQAYDIPLEAVRKDFVNRNQVSQHFVKKEEIEQDNIEGSNFVITAELRAVLTAVTDDVSLFQKMRNEITLDDLEDPLAKKIFAIMEECSESGNFSVSAILNRSGNDSFGELIFKSVNEYSGSISKSVQDSINLIKRNSLERKKQELQSRIFRLERSSLPEDKVVLLRLISEKMDLDKQITLLKG